MKITWPSRKRATMINFFISFVFFLTTLIFCFIVSDYKIVVFVSVFVFAMITAWNGYRAFFFSDDWFRAKEAQRADWWDKHPSLRTANNIFGWIFYSLVFAYLIWNAHRK